MVLAPALDQARLEQGKLLGLLDAIGLDQAQAVQRELWVQEALATAAIEGEQLNLESVRSSVAHRLGLADAPGRDRPADGLVQVMQDALANHHDALTLDRLCRWQSALFPGGTSGIVRIAVGRWRDHADAMQIVGGTPGRERVHYEAPPSAPGGDGNGAVSGVVRGHQAGSQRTCAAWHRAGGAGACVV